MIGKTLGGIRIGHIDQTDESDLNFLTRLGEHYDAIAAVKAGRMLFTVAGEALTASGKAMTTIPLTRRSGDQHRYSVTDREASEGVKAYWNDTSGAERKIVLAGSGDNAKQLRPTYASEADALAAAKAEWQRIQRGLAEFELTMAYGRPDILPESLLRVSGFKPVINDLVGHRGGAFAQRQWLWHANPLRGVRNGDKKAIKYRGEKPIAHP